LAGRTEIISYLSSGEKEKNVSQVSKTRTTEKILQTNRQRAKSPPEGPRKFFRKKRKHSPKALEGRGSLLRGGGNHFIQFEKRGKRMLRRRIQTVSGKFRPSTQEMSIFAEGGSGRLDEKRELESAKKGTSRLWSLRECSAAREKREENNDRPSLWGIAPPACKGTSHHANFLNPRWISGKKREGL